MNLKLHIFMHVTILDCVLYGAFLSSFSNQRQQKAYNMTSGPSCSKLTFSLVNDSLKFQCMITTNTLLFFV